MAFPSILIMGQNASVLIFILIVFFLIQNAKGYLLEFRGSIQWSAALFGIGAILSVLNISPQLGNEALSRALGVLPNYLYWCVLIILLVTHRKFLNLLLIYKAVFWGLLTTISYYLVFQVYLTKLPIFNPLTPNTFSFILICYTPIAVYYLRESKGNLWASLFLAFLVLILLQDGRRAGMVLVFFGGIIVLYGNRVNWKSIVLGSVIIPLLISLLYSSQVEAFIFKSSERIHEMLFKSEKMFTEDRSYLIRVAQVNKGLAIFNQHPYTGIGLNSFSKFETDFNKSFEGAKYVIDKKGIGTKSAHNSYISLLAEGGLFLIVPFIFLLGFNIFYALWNFNALKSTLPIYVGFMAMAVHLYFISDIVNVYAWFLISLASAFCYKH